MRKGQDRPVPAGRRPGSGAVRTGRSSPEATDLAWERVARDNPYWGVLSHREYDGATGPDRELAAFWASGQEHIDRTLRTIRARLRPDFAPRTALDFGCGVGRLLVPLARMSGTVYGVDVSGTMRALAGTNLAARGIANVTLAASLDDLATARGTLDLVHSTLVFQHIRAERGTRIFADLVAMLAPGGCGAVQVHLGRRAPRLRRAIGTARARHRVVNIAVNALRGSFSTEALPYEMNEYDLTALLVVLSQAGIAEVSVACDVRADAVDATLYFARPDAGPGTRPDARPGT
jgi:protein-L-isoaspartate O-methyltransferase